MKRSGSSALWVFPWLVAGLLIVGCTAETNAGGALDGSGEEAGSNAGRMGSGADPATQDLGAPSSLDPQIFSDIVGTAFVSPSTQRRAVRVGNAVSNIFEEECGPNLGYMVPIDSTEGRIDQAVYADLSLIAERGMAEPLLDAAREVEEKAAETGGDPTGAADLTEEDWERLLAEREDDINCQNTAIPGYEQFRQLQVGVWADVTLEVRQEPQIIAAEDGVKGCLVEKSGLELTDQYRPVDAYFAAVDFELSGLSSYEQWQDGQDRYSQIFAECTGPYFEAMEDGLSARRDELVERNREVLESVAQALAAHGYVP